MEGTFNGEKRTFYFEGQPQLYDKSGFVRDVESEGPKCEKKETYASADVIYYGETGILPLNVIEIVLVNANNTAFANLYCYGSLDEVEKTFGTNYNSTNMSSFQPHNATFKYFYCYDEMRTHVVDEFEVQIVGLNKSRSYASEEVYYKVLESNTYTTALYFDDISNSNVIFNTSLENGYEPNSIIVYSLSTMTKAVNVFSDFFFIIFTGLCICSVLILFNYGVKLVKERKYVIGILKALGIKDNELIFIFGCQVFLLMMLTILMYFIGSNVFIDLSNEILVKSLLELAPSHFLMDIDVLYLKLSFMLKNCLLVILIVFISFIIPLVKLKLLKPTNIIKAKE